MRPWVLFAICLAPMLAAVPAGASHPPVCIGSVDGEALIVLGGAATSPLQPYCTPIADGERVTWSRADPLVPSSPESGTCFSARDDLGDWLGLGERYTVQFTWNASEERLWVRAWDNDGAPVTWRDRDGNVIHEKRCPSDAHVERPDGTIALLWHVGFGETSGVIQIDIR